MRTFNIYSFSKFQIYYRNTDLLTIVTMLYIMPLKLTYNFVPLDHFTHFPYPLILCL